MTTSNNHQVLSNIKTMQSNTNNQNVLNDINTANLKTPQKTPLAHYYTGNTWNTDLPEKDKHDVFLLLSLTGTNRRKVIANAHIIYINGKMHIQNSTHGFLYEGMLIGWMDERSAMTLLQCD